MVTKLSVNEAYPAVESGQLRLLVARMAAVPRHFEALFAARWHAGVLARLQMPVLLLRSGATRAPARRLTALLAQARPQAPCGVLPNAGHLGPITDAQTVGHWMTAHIGPLRARHFQGAARSLV